MTFVQVKDNEWLDLDRKCTCFITPNNFVVVRWLPTANNNLCEDRFGFSTLEEAIAAQVRIIESCKEQIKINTYNPFQEIVDMIPDHLKEK